MNAIYKVIWNDALRLYQVVNEMCRSRRKGCSVKSVHVDGSSHSVAGSLKTGAVIAGSALAMLAAGMPAWGLDLDFQEGTFNMAGDRGNTPVTITEGQIPGDGGYFVINGTAFQSSSENIAAQDESTSLGSLVFYAGRFPEIYGKIKIEDADGNVLFDEADSTSRFNLAGNDAVFSYKISSTYQGVAGGENIILLRRLTKINLSNQQSSANGLIVYGGSHGKDSSELVDLDVGITGGGNIQFAYTAAQGEADMGYIYLNPLESSIAQDQVAGESISDYSGRTTVGNVPGEENKAVTVIFGKNDAFGKTSNLYIHDDSSVWFADKDLRTKHTQTVGGLTGKGELNFGNAAEVTLHQTSTTAGYTDTVKKTVRIDNIFTGQESADGTSGAIFNIEFADDLAGYEVFFTDAQDQTHYTGLITLSGGGLTAYNDQYTVQNGKAEYDGVNEILLNSTLELKNSGQLRVSSVEKGVGQVNNLIISNGNSWSADSAANSNAIAFDEVTLGTGQLNVKGDLTLNSNATVSVDAFAEGGIEDAVEGKSWLAADDGLVNTLIKVDGNVSNSGSYTLTLDGKAVQDDATTEITQDGEQVADATWSFTDNLVFNESGKSFDIEYTLTTVGIRDGKEFELTAAEGTQSDFKAQITGTGDLLLNGSGATIEIGSATASTYTGKTTVTTGTSVVVTHSSGLGSTGALSVADSADITLNEDVKQTVSSLEGSGKIDISSGAELFLDQNSEGDATVENLITMTSGGVLKVELGSSGSDNKLVFANSGTDFNGGTIDLNAGWLDLGASKNVDFSDAKIDLASGTRFTFGSNDKIQSLTAESGVRLEASTLTIGGAPSMTVGSLNLSGGGVFNITSIDVADDLSLIDYDGDAMHSQSFIDADSASISGDYTIDITDATDLDNGRQQITLDYKQSGVTVAQTTWELSDALQAGSGFDASVLLTGIEVLDDEELLIAGTDNKSKELSAALSSATSEGAVRFSGGTIELNAKNSYTVETIVDADTTVVLKQSDAMGQTGKLSAAGGVQLESGVEQTVRSFNSGSSGTISLLGNSVLTLDAESAQSIANVFAGSGTFAVDLGDSGRALSFSNSGNSGFSGTLSLGNLYFDLSNGAASGNASMVESAGLVLNSGAVVNAADTEGRVIGSLAFNGGTLQVGAIDAADAGSAVLKVSGDVSVDSGKGTIATSGVDLFGTGTILSASTTGVSKDVISYGGNFSGSVADLTVTGLDKASEIRNTESGDVVAYGKWSGLGANLDKSGKTISVDMVLDSIELADADEGLILNASGLGANQTLKAAIADYGDKAGKITFTSGSFVLSGEKTNTYTGETVVTAGSVAASKKDAFGHTSNLSVSSGGSVSLTAGYAQRVQSIHASGDDALAGSGALVIDGKDGSSYIDGSNAGLTGSVALVNGHALTTNSTTGVGSSGVLNVADGTTFAMEGANGSFTKTLSGSGTVKLTGSNVSVSGDNSGFTGTWQLENSGEASTGMTVSGTADAIDAALGSGASIALGDGTVLALQVDSNDLTIDDELTGTGRLEVAGTSGYSFGFETNLDDADQFTGTVALTGIGMTVGGEEDYGANNAANLEHANLELSDGSLLTVVGAVTAFDTVAVHNGGFSIGKMGFFSPTDNASGLSQLTIGQLNLDKGGSGQIFINMPASNNGDVLGTVVQSSLISGGVNPFQTLIATDFGIGDSFNQLSLVNSGNITSVSQQITDGTNTVATGYYGFQLGLADSNTDVGIQYNLTQIDIWSGQSLTLSESGTLGALISSDSGTGNLVIAKSGVIELTNGGNRYTGSTTVIGQLTANANALGSGALLVSGAYTNAGANTVSNLDVGENGVLKLDSVLTVSPNTSGSKILGAITGSGALNVSAESLTITANSGTAAYSGTVGLGTADGSATLVLNGVNALGAGSIAFVNAGSVVDINHSGNLAFSNAISGSGTINVDLSGGNFEFTGNSQGNLASGSNLVLEDAVFDLSDSTTNYNDDVALKLDITVNSSSTLANAGTSDKTIHGLTLDGGLVDLGELNSEHGQISLSGGKLTVTASGATIKLDTVAQTSESGDRVIDDNGHDLFSGGLFDLNIFENVGSVTSAGSNLSGNHALISGLGTDSGFSGTSEKLLQDADGINGAYDLVAVLSRDSGAFYYNADEDLVFLEYGFKAIDLQWERSGQGLTIDADGYSGNAVLSATVTGSGNLVLGGTMAIGGSGDNTYTGATYVQSGAHVTAAKDDAFGTTKQLDIASDADVKINDGISQTVGALTGEGTLTLGSGAGFTIANESGNSSDSIVINSLVSGGSDAAFTIDGAYGESGRAAVSFETAAKLAGTTFRLENVQFELDSTSGNNAKTAASADDFVIGSNTQTTIAADRTSYQFKELSFESGTLAVTGVTLQASGGAAAVGTPVIHVGTLDVSGTGSLSVAANIDSSFDILKNDQSQYVSTLIAFDELTGDQANLKAAAELAASEIKNGEKTVAYVGWSGKVTWNQEEGQSGGSVGMAYQVANVQLADADDGSDGLVISTKNDGDSSLTALVTDYVSGGKAVAGTITFAGGDVTIGSASASGANTYTGRTQITGGTVTLAKDSGFGLTSELAISSGSANLAGFSQTVGGLTISDSGSITGTDTGTLTLGIADGGTSTVSGSGSTFDGTIHLVNGHTLTMNDAAGLGSAGTFALDEDTAIRIENDADGTLSKTLSGAGSVTLDHSNVSVTADNSGFSGLWTVSNGSALSATSTGSLTADAMLGSDAISLVGTDDSLNLTLGASDGASASLDNEVTGSGSISVVSTSAGDTRFDFAKTWTSGGFTGGMTILSTGSGSLTMAVSAAQGSSGAANAANLADANFTVGENALLRVESGGVVSTFKDLAFSDGDIAFDSNLARQDSGFGSLNISGSISGGGNVVIGEVESGKTSDTLANTGVVAAAGDDLFFTLIDAQSGTVDADKWTLNGSSGHQTIRQNIEQGEDGSESVVAHAVYDYGLAAGDSGHDLGIAYDMTGIEILTGKTLELTEGGELSVTLSDEPSGSNGSLKVASGALVLTGENTYTGLTTVAGGANLTAGASGLGKTSGLVVEDKAAYTNSGANTVGSLTVDGTLTLADTLTVTGSGSINAGATVSGSGTLALQSGTTTVYAGAAASSGYTGDITLADGADLTLVAQSGSAGLGTGGIAHAADDAGDSTVLVSGTGNATLTNAIDGNLVLNVDLDPAADSGDKFAFAASQSDGAFTGTLTLVDGTIELFNAANAAGLKSASLSLQSEGVLVVNGAALADRGMADLTLAGGLIDFGVMNTANAGSGQISLSGALNITGKTNVKLALADLADADGSSAFGTGQTLYLIEGSGFETVDTDNLAWSGSDDSITQTVQQGGRNVANLTFSSGSFDADDGGVFAQWDLTEIELLSDASGGYSIAGDGTIAALITGSGDMTLASGDITIGGSGDNTYSGSTFVTGAAVTLAKDEALGNTELLDISNGSVAFGETTQTIGAMNVGESGAFTMGPSGSLTLTADSTIASANAGVSGAITVSSGAALTLTNAEAAGSAVLYLAGVDSENTVSSVVLSGINGADGSASEFDNLVSGNGVVELISGSHVKLSNTANKFVALDVDRNSTGVVSGMDQTSNALGDEYLRANLRVSGALALSGESGWTLSNVLNLDESGTVSVSANGGAFNFSSGNASNAGNIKGTIALSDATFRIDGDNETALTNATLRIDAPSVGKTSSVAIATGDDSQHIGGLELNGGELIFEGTIGADGKTPTLQLGQLDVGSLTLSSGTIRVTAADTASGGTIAQGNVVSVQDEGVYQSLITSSEVINGDLEHAGINLDVKDVSGNSAQLISSNITDGNYTVAYGKFGFDLALGDSGKSLGVQYSLQEIELLAEKTLNISENGSLNAHLTGSGNLTVSSAEELTLSDRGEDDANDYTGATTVTGKLTAEAHTLGTLANHTSLLDVQASGKFTNAGGNVIGALNEAQSGSITLNDVLTIAGDAASSVAGKVNGAGSLALQSGNLSVAATTQASDYSGNVLLGTTDKAASLTYQSGAAFGTGTIGFVNSNSKLAVEDLTSGYVLANLISGAGLIGVTGTAANAAFGFNEDQTLLAEGTQVSLTSVDYNLSAKGSDVLAKTSLAMTSGVLTVNAGDDAGDTRNIGGLNVSGTTIEFGTLGAGTGHIDLQGKALEAEDVTLKLNAQLSNKTGDNGAAAMAASDSVTLIANANAGSTVSLDELTLATDEAGNASFKQVIYQDGDAPAARIEGVFSGLGFEAVEGSQNQNLVANLTNQKLVILGTYVVSTNGEIGLQVTDEKGKAGNLTVSGAGTTLTLTNIRNDYYGATNVESGAALVLKAQHTLGNTSALNVASGATVNFGSFDQTIGSISASGTLISTDSTDSPSGVGTLTIASGGTVTGANSGFHMNVDFYGTLEINNADGLGDGDISARSGELVLNGARGTFDNNVDGSGGLAIASGADVALTGTNTFTGGLTVDQASVTASGDIKSHIGSGPIALNNSGQAAFTLTDPSGSANGDWTWTNAVTGDGSLALTKGEELNSVDELLFSAGSLSGFSGDLTIGNWTLSLASGSGTLKELSGSQLHDLILAEGTDAVVSGQASLSGKNLTVNSGASLSFTDVGAPGETTAGSHLAVDSLTLDKGYIINLNIDEEKSEVSAGDLLTQDTSSGTSIAVATAGKGGISLAQDGSLTVNGSTPSSDGTIRFAVDQGENAVEAESGHVADAIYGYDIAVDTTDANSDSLTVRYDLDGVSILKDKTLVLSGASNDDSAEENALSVYVTGEGGLRIAENSVRLAETETGNSYAGATTVTRGASLYAEANTLGTQSAHTSLLDIAGAAYIEGDNVVGKLNVGSYGVLDIAAQTSFTLASTINSPDEEGSRIAGRLTGEGKLTVTGNGMVHDGIDPDLTIEGSQGGFHGDLVLGSGAWVDIEGNSLMLFGNTDSAADILVSKNSLLTISNSRPGDALFASVIANNEDVGDEGGGIVELSLANADDVIRFASGQATAGFTGTFDLQKGTIDFGDLYYDDVENPAADVFDEATLVLRADATAILNGVNNPNNANVSKLGSLTMNGGTIEAGAIGYTENGPQSSLIDLQNGVLTLNKAQGSTIEFSTSTDAAAISDAGTEVLLAGASGAEVAIIDNIGSLVLVDGNDSKQVSGSGTVSIAAGESGYLTATTPAGTGPQVISQNVNGKSAEVAESTRKYSEALSYNADKGTLSVVYEVDKLGLLYQTNAVSANNYLIDSNWYGLTLTAVADQNTSFGAVIANGSSGETGNIVFKGAENGLITLTGNNTYEGKTWLTSNAAVVFGADNAFGSTEALRIDSGSSVDLNGHAQTAGALFALGANALKGSGQLTVAGDALLQGANEALSADLAFNGDVTIEDEAALGTGNVALGAGVDLTITGTEASGSLVNAITGNESTSINVASGADITFESLKLGDAGYTGALNLTGSSAAALDTEGAIANAVSVEKGSRLSLAAASESDALSFENAEISGTLEIADLSFNLSEEQSIFQKGSELSAGAGAVVSVGDQVSGSLSNLTLGSGSRIDFAANGTPGAAENPGVILDGALSLSGSVTVGVTLEDYVNANPDAVAGAQEALAGRPLTGQDMMNETAGVISTLIDGAVANSGNASASINLDVKDGYDAQKDELTIAVSNNGSDEKVAEGIYGYSAAVSDDGADLNLVYGLKEVSLVNEKTLELAGGYDAAVSDNTLSAKVTGAGSLEITSGTVSLVNDENSYSGATTVEAGAALIAGAAGHALGRTSALVLAGTTDGSSGGSAEILGVETVGSLRVGDNAALKLATDASKLTVAGGETNEISGELTGAGDLAITGSATQLTVYSANAGYTGDVALESGAGLTLKMTDSLGSGSSAGTISIAEGASLRVEVEAADPAVDSVSGATRKTSATLANAVTGSGTVVVNLSSTESLDNNQLRFSFADDQTQNFNGKIVLKKGGYSLAYATDDKDAPMTANQNAAYNAEIVVEKEGHLFVSTKNHENNRFIDKHIGSLTLAGGNIYFGGLRYDMGSLDAGLGGQLELNGESGGKLQITQKSFVNLDAGATNSLSSAGSELLAADEGAKIDLIQHAADVVLGTDAAVSISDDGLDVVNAEINNYLSLDYENTDAEQTLQQNGRDVAKVTRSFGEQAFGVNQSETENDHELWDVYLNYHVSKLELIDSGAGLVITNTDADDDRQQSLSMQITGSGNLTLSGVSGSSILLGNDADSVSNDYTGETLVSGKVTVVAAQDEAFGKTSALTVESGAAVDFGDYSQTLGNLYADGTLKGTADSTLTITGKSEINGSNSALLSNIVLAGEGTVTTSDNAEALGSGAVTIAEGTTLVVADQDGGKLDNNLSGTGTLVIGTSGAAPTGSGAPVELTGSNEALDATIRVESGWSISASMAAGETTEDRIGSSSLALLGSSEAAFSQAVGDLHWNSNVSGSGNLKLEAESGKQIEIDGGLEDFKGTVTIAGGELSLGTGNDSNTAHLGGTENLVVSADQGNSASVKVEAGDKVVLSSNLTVKGEDAKLVFEAPVTPGTIDTDGQLRVDGDLTVNEGGVVSVKVDGKLDMAGTATADLTVQDVLTADRSEDLALVIAEAHKITLGDGALEVLDEDGNPITSEVAIDITDNGESIATGYYKYDLSTNESKTQLGAAYQLTRVDVNSGETLALSGPHIGDYRDPKDFENAASLDAAITGTGGFALTDGQLTLTSTGNAYAGATTVGNGAHGSTKLTVAAGSSLGNTESLRVFGNAELVNESVKTTVGSMQIDDGGRLTLGNDSVLTVKDSDAASNIAGTISGAGSLVLGEGVTLAADADKAEGFTGDVSLGKDARYELTSADGAAVNMSFSASGTVGLAGDFTLNKASSDFSGTFALADGSSVTTSNLAALGSADASIGTADDSAKATLTVDIDEDGTLEQTLGGGITLVKDGSGALALSDNAMGAGAVTAAQGSVSFGADDEDVYETVLTVKNGASASGFGTIGGLTVEKGGMFSMSGSTFTVSSSLSNNGTINVGAVPAEGSEVSVDDIGNTLVIDGDYVVDGGTLNLNALISGNSGSKADSVEISGGITGSGLIDVNVHSSSTGGELDYMGLVSVQGGDDGDSLKLKDSIKIGDLYYRLMWSSQENEYYLQSSVTDPGDGSWNTEDVENVGGGTRSALAFVEAQTFDLSLHDHIGETLYVDPLTGEERSTTFWMIQRGDWTKFDNASGQLSADGHVYTTHLGADLVTQQTDAGTVRWGVLGSFADGQFDLSSNVDGKIARGEFRGYSVGGYLAFESSAESGPFAALQLRYNRFDNENGKDEYDVDGVSVTAEAGYDMLLSKGTTESGRTYEWRVEPHVRAYWTNFGDPDDYTTPLGETYSSSFDNGMLVRVGARTKIASLKGTGPAVQAYAEANWVYNNGDYSTTVATKYGESTSTQEGANFAELRLGLEAQFTPSVNLWVEGHHQTGADNYESSGAMIGFKYRW